ncbi:hypothetical protein ABE10_11050 [Bacillus toyonensis]|nr:hypothetical protein [Bacillus toyonensis]
MKYRAEEGITLSEIARTSHRYGTNWGVQSVRNIEAGAAAPTLPTLISLLLTLNYLRSDELTLADIFNGVEYASPPSARGHAFKGEWLASIVSGAPVAVGSVENIQDGERLRRDVFEQLTTYMWNDASLGIPADTDWKDLEDLTEREASLAEERAARTLEMSTDSLRLWARRLWQRPLEDESRARAGEESSPQARGNTTRKLLREIREAVEREAHNGG